MDALDRWVKDARGQGRSDEEIRQALLDRGYTAEQAENVLGRRKSGLLLGGAVVAVVVAVAVMLILGGTSTDTAEPEVSERFTSLVLASAERMIEGDSRACFEAAAHARENFPSDAPWSDTTLAGCLSVVGVMTEDKDVCDNALGPQHPLFSQCRFRLAVGLEDAELCVGRHETACREALS